MKIICEILLAFVSICFLVFCNYKKEIVRRLDKREHALKSIYGFPMFVIDYLLGGILLKQNTKVNEDISKVYMEKDTKENKYLYIVKKFTISVLIFSIVLFIGIGMCISNEMNNNEVKSLKRLSNGEGETNYHLKASINNKSKEIEIIVQDQKRTVDETLILLNDAYDEVINEMLGDNKDCRKITHPLNLVTSVEDDLIMVSWEISNSDIINYEGQIVGDIPEEGIELILKFTLYLDEVSEEYEVNVVVYPDNNEE
ncbi:MAG: hypothetical protein ACI4DS_05745, partial [Eubacterium sp.]